MQNVELLAILQCVFAQLDLLVIHSTNVFKNNKIILLKDLRHAPQLHVAQMQFAENKMVLEHVLVLMNILEILTKDADLNVFSTLIAHQISLVFVINVKIHVQELVVKMLFAKSLITCPLVVVSLDILEIPSDIAMSYKTNVRNPFHSHYH